MDPTTRNPIVPDLLLERYRLGELPDAERARVAALVEANPGVAARLAALDTSDREITAAGRMKPLARDVRDRMVLLPADERRLRSKEGLMLAAGAAAAVVIAFLVLRPSLTPAPNVPPIDPPGLDRIKGLEPSLAVFRQTSHGSERLVDDTLAHKGDVLRLGYIAAGARFGAIASLDGRGIVTWHLPKGGGVAATLAPGSPALLDEAYELDDAPKAERFYFVTSASPFLTAVVNDAIQRDSAGRPGVLPARLTLPQGLDQFSVALRK